MGASKGLTTPLEEMISDLIVPVTMLRKDSTEGTGNRGRIVGIVREGSNCRERLKKGR